MDIIIDRDLFKLTVAFPKCRIFLVHCATAIMQIKLNNSKGGRRSPFIIRVLLNINIMILYQV